MLPIALLFLDGSTDLGAVIMVGVYLEGFTSIVCLAQSHGNGKEGRLSGIEDMFHVPKRRRQLGLVFAQEVQSVCLTRFQLLALGGVGT